MSFLFSYCLFYFPSRVYLECSLLLPGILLPVLPHPAGRAGLWHLLLLQDQLSLRSFPREPGPEGLHQTGAQLWVMLNITWRRIQHTIGLQTAPDCPYRKKMSTKAISDIFCSSLYILKLTVQFPREAACQLAQHDVISDAQSKAIALLSHTYKSLINLPNG